MSIEWNGKGLPPIGTECEFQNFSDSPWRQVKVLAYHNDEVWLKPLNGAQSFAMGNPEGFRPIRTEAERRRESQIEAISQVLEYRDGCSAKPMAGWIVDAIAAGKIPGIRLTDG